MPPNDREFESLSRDVRAMREDLDEIKTLLAEQRGASKVVKAMLAFFGVSSLAGLGAALNAVLTFVRPH
jgi:hypothetical protein